MVILEKQANVFIKTYKQFSAAAIILISSTLLPNLQAKPAQAQSCALTNAIAAYVNSYHPRVMNLVNDPFVSNSVKQQNIADWHQTLSHAQTILQTGTVPAMSGSYSNRQLLGAISAACPFLFAQPQRSYSRGSGYGSNLERQTTRYYFNYQAPIQPRLLSPSRY